MARCSIGEHLNQICQEPTIGLITPTNTDQKILQLRPSCALKTVCNHHWDTYYSRYESHQLRCSDPFQKHKTIKRSIRPISLETALKHSSLKLIPGKKICDSCQKLLFVEWNWSNQTTVITWHWWVVHLLFHFLENSRLKFFRKLKCLNLVSSLILAIKAFKTLTYSHYPTRESSHILKHSLYLTWDSPICLIGFNFFFSPNHWFQCLLKAVIVVNFWENWHCTAHNEKFFSILCHLRLQMNTNRLGNYPSLMNLNL